MKVFDKKRFLSFSLLKVLLLGLFMLAGATTPLYAQAITQGKFTLPYEVRWGDKMLAAGAYTYSIAPIGSSVQNISSIGSGHTPVLMVVRAEAGGPANLMIVMATSQKDHPPVMNGLAIETTPEGPTVRTMCLEKYEVVLDFQVPKAKKVMYARGAQPGAAVAASKASN